MKEFQEFLIKRGFYLGESGADGIVGKMTRAAAYNYAKMEFFSLKYKWNEKAIIGIRFNDVFTDKFTDYALVIDKDKCVEIVKWTTKPGKYYVSNPLTVGGITGTGCIKEGQYEDTYQFIGGTKNKWSAPYFKQIKTITVYRDGNKDNKLDKNVTQVAPTWYGFFLHAMGKGFSIWNWSAGCNGSPKDEWNKQIAPYFSNGEIITYTIIDSR